MSDAIPTGQTNLVPLFADDTEWERFATVARSWIGTPFRHCVAAKGRGVDCSLLVGSILNELGIVTHLNYTYYHADWYVNGANDLIIAYMEKHIQNHLAPGLSAARAEGPLLRGDVLTLQIAHNQLNNHAVIYMGDGMILHAMSFGSVVEVTFPKTWATRIGTVFRLYKG